MSHKDLGHESNDKKAAATLDALKTRIARWTGEEEIVAAPIPGLYLFRRETPGAPETVLYEPSIAILAQGAKRIYSGDGSFVYDTSRFLVAAVEMPTVAEVISASPEKPCLGVVMNIDRHEIAQLMLDGKLPSPQRQQSELGISAGAVTPDLLDAVCRLLGLLDAPPDIPVMTPIIQREILYRLLISDQGMRLRRIATAGSRSNQISQAIDWLKENFARPLKIEELAARANMSPSTFHHHFRVLTARSPLQYQKWLRLNEARRLMLTEHLDAASAAYRVGYESPSQFSREYGRLFGNPPLRDISNLRSIV